MVGDAGKSFHKHETVWSAEAVGQPGGLQFAHQRWEEGHVVPDPRAGQATRGASLVYILLQGHFGGCGPCGGRVFSMPSGQHWV